MESKTTAIRAIKQEVRLQEWSAQIEAQQPFSNGVRKRSPPKTYYYYLKKVRAHYLEYAPDIVPVTIPKCSSNIRIEKNGLQISLSTDVNPETLLAGEVIHADETRI